MIKKYSSPSPLQSPKIVRTRKLSVLENLRNNEIDEKVQSDQRNSCNVVANKYKDDQINYKELYEKEKKEKEVKLFLLFAKFLVRMSRQKTKISLHDICLSICRQGNEAFGEI